MTLRFAIAPVLLAALSAGTAGACDLELRGVNDIRFSGHYDPFAPLASPRTVRFTVHNDDGQDCAFAVGIDRGRNGDRLMRGEGRALRYEIVGADNRPVADAPATPDNGLLVGHYEGSSGNAKLEVHAVLPAGQMVGAGDYSDKLTINLYELVGGQPGRRHDSQTVDVEAKVGSTLRAALVVGGVRGDLEGRVATLDFGMLETGKALPFHLEIAGNAPYKVKLKSENRGRLAGQEAGNRKGRIDYSLSMDGQGIPLNGAAEIPLPSPTERGQGASAHAFDVRIGDTSRALAGRYADSITVTVSAN